MEIRFIAVGRVKDRELRSLLEDYYTRIRRYGRFSEIEIVDGDIAEVAAKILKAIPERSRTVALEVDGQSQSSHDLSRYVERARQDAVQNLVFLIGGSYGLPREVSQACDYQLSLSKMILPHRLARLLLAEQVYRAFTILNREPYSH